MIILTPLTIKDIAVHLDHLYEERVPTTGFPDPDYFIKMEARFLHTFQDTTHHFPVKGEKSNDPS